MSLRWLVPPVPIRPQPAAPPQMVATGGSSSAESANPTGTAAHTIASDCWYFWICPYYWAPPPLTPRAAASAIDKRP